MDRQYPLDRDSRLFTKLAHNNLFERHATLVGLGLFVVALLWFGLTRSDYLDGYDAVNFAFSINQFDLSSHQPHPPGAPLFVFFAKALHGLGFSHTGALTWLAAVGGSIFVVAWFAIFLQLTDNYRWSAAAALVVLCMPGLWVTSTRPMSDALACGLVAVVIALLVHHGRYRGMARFAIACFIAALAVGIRPQLGVFIFLLLLLSTLMYLPRPKTLMAGCVAFLIGNLLWLIPAVILQAMRDVQGLGLMAYFHHILEFGQTFDDASGSPVLSDNFSLRQFLKRVVAHGGAMLYTGLGLSFWYPDGANAYLSRFGTTLNPWNPELQEWTVAGSVLAILLVIGWYRVACAWSWRFTALSRVWVFTLMWSLLYFAVVVLVVPPHQRFYLPLLPVLLLPALIGLKKCRMAGAWWGVVLVLMFTSTYSVWRAAQENLSPPVALALAVKETLGEQGSAILLLNANGRRHVQWYLPDLQVADREDEANTVDILEFLRSGHRVLTNHPESYLHAEWLRAEKIGHYARSIRVWMRHTGTDLYELKLQ